MREWVFKMRGGLWTLLFVVILFMVGAVSPEKVCWAVGYALGGAEDA